jgi:hypothetical protein
MKTDLPAKTRCPFCGNEFTKGENECGGSCGLIGNCGLMCCPRCRYSFVEESKTVQFFKKIWPSKKEKELKQ